MDHGKQIRLFLTDGSANGIRYAELMNWTGQAFACPKSLFTNLKRWPETQRAGVYVLVGLNKKGEDAVYIGESENVLARLLSHLSQSTLDDIVEAFFFTSKDDNLTKGHITFLEQRLVKRAEEAKQYVVENVQKPSEKTLPKMDLEPMEEFLEKFYLVAAVLGCDVFKTASSEVSPDSAGLFQLAEKGIAAVGYPSEVGFVVRKGSTATFKDVAAMPQGYRAIKADLKNKSVLVTEGDHLKFTQDFSFKSSSAAACVVTGLSRSGPQSWVQQDGKILREVEAEKAKADEKEVAASPIGP
jgi:Domain of unknown function (DUF4357)